MSERNGFGFKIEMVEKIVLSGKLLTKKEWNKLRNDLCILSDIRNYFAHTVLSINETDEGKMKFRGKRKINLEVDLDEKIKSFKKCLESSFPLILQISEHAEKDYTVRKKYFCEN